MSAPITALYAGLLALLLLALIVPIIKGRRGLKVGIGDGGHRALQQAVRAHGNATEFIPIFLILLFLFEVNGGNKIFLHAMGAAFFLARVSHAIGLHKSIGVTIWRMAGVIGTCLITLSLAVANLLCFFAVI
jgi:uncharacterized protein